MTSFCADPRTTDRFLLSAGTILLGLFLTLPIIPNYSNAVTPFLTVYGAAAALWLFAVWRVTQAGDSGPRTLRIILVFAVLFRVAVLPQASVLDDDLFRYLWDGRMSGQGINPYRYAPSDVELAGHRDDHVYPQINFPYVPTIYPPLTQLVFSAVVGLFGEHLIAMKLVWTAFDALVILATLGLLRAARRNPAWVIVYAWAPLTIKEVAGSGHMDAFPALLTVLAVGWVGQRRWGSALALGAAIAAKLYPVLLVPVVVRRLGALTVLIPVVLLLAIAPFASVSAAQMTQGLRTYAEYWVFNPGLFDIIQRTCAVFTSHHVMAAKLLVGVTVGAVVLWRAARRNDTVVDLSESALWILASVLLLAPTANPWYLLWMLPFLCVHPNAGLLAWVALSVLSYGFYYSGTDIAWLRLVEYAPVFGLLLRAGLKTRRPNALETSWARASG